MASIKQGILGGFKGKVGSVVGSSWKGIAVMKAKPLSVANPNTPAQGGNRLRQTNVLKIAQAIGVVNIRMFWNRQALKMSGFNLFMQVNKGLFDIDGSWLNNDVIISQGIIEASEITLPIVHNVATMVTVSYPTTATGYQKTTDIALAIIVDSETGEVMGVASGTNRATGQITVPTDLVFGLGKEYRVLLAFRSLDGLRTSMQVADSFTVVA